MMKKAVFILGLVISASITYAQTYSTNEEVVFEASETTNMQHVKSAIDSNGFLHIVSIDENTGIVKYSTNCKGQWKTESITYLFQGDLETTSSFPNIVVDKNDNIIVSMFGRYKEDLILAIKKTSDAHWKFEDAKTNGELQKFYAYKEYSDMCIDDNGGLHIICSADFWDQSEKKHDESAVYFYKPANGKWSNEIVVAGVVNVFSAGKHPSIASHKDMVYASFGGSKSLFFAQKKIGAKSWETEKFLNNDNSMNTWKFKTSLDVSTNGNIAFSFYEYFAESEYYGMNVLEKNNCGIQQWKIDTGIPEKVSKQSSAIAIDKNGKTFLAFGAQEMYLFAKSCNCSQNWEQIFSNKNVNSQYIDMLIDKNNNVHAFYTQDKKVYHLEAKPNSTTVDCNYKPAIYIKTLSEINSNEEWIAELSASDPECDKVKIYSNNLPEGFQLIDKGDGKAIIKGITSKTSGNLIFDIICNDNKHKEDGNESKITLTLVIGGKSSIKHNNNCIGNKTKVLKTASIKGENEAILNNNQPETGNSESKETIVENNDCEDFIKRYEAFAEEYVPLMSKIKSDPAGNMDAVTKVGSMTEKIGSWSVEWANLTNCNNDKNYKSRYEAAKKKIHDANNQ